MTALDTGKRNVAQVFQVPVIYKSMTVGENLGFPLVCRGASPQKIKARVETVAERLGLTQWLKRPANALTADMKQLVSLGRGLVREDVAAILLDEPYAGLDMPTQIRLARRLSSLPQRLVMVTHDPIHLADAERILWLDGGRIVLDGPAETVLPAYTERMVQLGAMEADDTPS